VLPALTIALVGDIWEAFGAADLRAQLDELLFNSDEGIESIWAIN